MPCVVGLTLAIACQTAQSQAMYRIKPIGGLPGGCALVKSQLPLVSMGLAR